MMQAQVFLMHGYMYVVYVLHMQGLLFHLSPMLFHVSDPSSRLGLFTFLWVHQMTIARALKRFVHEVHKPRPFFVIRHCFSTISNVMVALFTLL